MRSVRRIVLRLVLLGARLAEHDGIGDLEMRRVGGRATDAPSLPSSSRFGRGAEVVFDVAGAFDLRRA